MWAFSVIPWVKHCVGQGRLSWGEYLGGLTNKEDGLRFDGNAGCGEIKGPPWWGGRMRVRGWVNGDSLRGATRSLGEE